MSFFKRKTKLEEVSSKSKPAEKKEKINVAPKAEPTQAVKNKSLIGVLRSPRLTEKTSAASAENKYIFIIEKNANKNQ